jgi:Zn-dependent peptidase ImmA (M78 family)
MAARRVSFPPLPKTVSAPGGEVTVVLSPKIKHPDGSECWGIWDESIRTITLDRTATKRHQWKVLFHELCHVALDDSGLSNGMEASIVEAICDAIASARMRERFG